ncbi:MAG: GH3 auxin-responsive promoter family protein [Planctomycetes bacterium]|nr:GH3 auxin-responsive promoter family protein [Planctomycetota bacterium]
MSLLHSAARAVFRFLLGRIGKIVATPVRRHLFAFEAATHNPQVVQDALLHRLLSAQSDTGFGRDHRFRDIATYEDFCRQVAVAGYEAIEPYIARMRQGDFNALVSDGPVRMFALTSGTTATRKYIPVTASYLADYRRGWNIWGLKAFRDHPDTKLRPIVQVSGDWNECQTEAGTPCGAVTGLTARMQKRLIRWLYCVPACVGSVKDAAAKYYLILRLSLPREVAMIIAANPSTMLALARAGDREKEHLIRDLSDGTLSPRYDIPATVREAVAPKMRKRHPQRAKELEAIVNRTGTLYPKDYWPSYCLLGNWMGGSVGAYLRHYPRYFGDRLVRDVGLIASEGRMTIPMTSGTPSGVLDVTSHFFEFIPEAEGDSPQPAVLRAHELAEGRNYYILLTTAYGLYRYHIHDVVRVTGFHNKTPLLEFLSKGSHFSNLTGEKLSEYHVTAAVQDVVRELNVPLGTYSVAPCWPNSGDDLTPYYGLFVECGDLPSPAEAARFARRLDQRLAELNVEYAAKRESQRLAPLRVQLLSAGTWQEWDRKRLEKTGGTLEQYKHPCLIGDVQFRTTMPVEQEVGPEQSGKPPVACARS